MEAPESSNSKSSVSEPSWAIPIWFWALPVLATPWSPTVWLELSPPPVTLNDWSISPLSASCSNSWLSAGAPLLPGSSWRCLWGPLPPLLLPLLPPPLSGGGGGHGFHSSQGGGHGFHSSHWDSPADAGAATITATMSAT